MQATLVIPWRGGWRDRGGGGSGGKEGDIVSESSKKINTSMHQKCCHELRNTLVRKQLDH